MGELVCTNKSSLVRARLHGSRDRFERESDAGGEREERRERRGERGEERRGEERRREREIERERERRER